tara:strand:- start:702 stop:920 length:219 start_codon:yes stop_codon:yes gene_type:complete
MATATSTQPVDRTKARILRELKSRQMSIWAFSKVMADAGHCCEKTIRNYLSGNHQTSSVLVDAMLGKLRLKR